MADTFASFDRKVAGFQKELGNDAMGHALGKMAKEEATKAADADIGNASFSGWPRKNPIELDTAYDIIGPGRILFKPKRRAAGPWTVAESGRHAGSAGIGPLQGPTLTSTGRISRARRKRWNGQTKGKQTATDALKAIDKKAPGVVDKQISRAVRKFFS